MPEPRPRIWEQIRQAQPYYRSPFSSSMNKIFDWTQAGVKKLDVPFQWLMKNRWPIDPKTGEELWRCDGLGKLVYTSPVCKDGVVVAMSGYYGPALAARAGGKGDVTQTHRLWRHDQRNPQRIGSPVIVGDHVFILNESGVAHCFELKTGKETWQHDKRLGSEINWGSFVVANGRLYATNQAGETIVLSAGPKFERIAVNAIGEKVLASIAISDGDIFIRSHKHLWCIGEKK